MARWTSRIHNATLSECNASLRFLSPALWSSIYARSAANVMFIILTATGIGSDQRSYVTWNEKAEAQVIWKQLV